MKTKIILSFNKKNELKIMSKYINCLGFIYKLIYILNYITVGLFFF